jgi:hypothetical protein
VRRPSCSQSPHDETVIARCAQSRAGSATHVPSPDAYSESRGLSWVSAHIRGIDTFPTDGLPCGEACGVPAKVWSARGQTANTVDFAEEV